MSGAGLILNGSLARGWRGRAGRRRSRGSTRPRPAMGRTAGPRCSRLPQPKHHIKLHFSNFSAFDASTPRTENLFESSRLYRDSHRKLLQGCSVRKGDLETTNHSFFLIKRDSRFTFLVEPPCRVRSTHRRPRAGCRPARCRRRAGLCGYTRARCHSSLKYVVPIRDFTYKREWAGIMAKCPRLSGQ
jgi:hypothetical protein